MLAIRTGDHFFFLFSFIQGLTFTVTSFHFILFHLISIKGFMSLWSHVWRKKQPTCLGCSHAPSAEPPVRTQDAGLPQVGSAGGLRRWAPAGGREPSPWLVDLSPTSHALILLLWVTLLPADQWLDRSRLSWPTGIANPRLAALRT